MITAGAAERQERRQPNRRGSGPAGRPGLAGAAAARHEGSTKRGSTRRRGSGSSGGTGDGASTPNPRESVGSQSMRMVRVIKGHLQRRWTDVRAPRRGGSPLGRDGPSGSGRADSDESDAWRVLRPSPLRGWRAGLCTLHASWTAWKQLLR
jgi:hypothetical protein